MKGALDNHGFQLVFHRRFCAHLDHALRPAGRAETAGERHRSEQEVALVLARLQRHHEALQAQRLLVERGHRRGIHRHNPLFFHPGGDVGEGGPGHHVGALGQRRKRTQRAVHASTLPVWQGRAISRAGGWRSARWQR
ncbi:hypothetical protein FQZ97_1093310 [compost metagenome]